MYHRINIFPNPFVDGLNINLKQQLQGINVSIFDLLGVVYYKKTFTNEKELTRKTAFLN